MNFLSQLLSSYSEEKLFVAVSALLLNSTYKASVFSEINPEETHQWDEMD